MQSDNEQNIEEDKEEGEEEEESKGEEHEKEPGSVTLKPNRATSFPKITKEPPSLSLYNKGTKKES